ncbi:MAG: hypothetical protein AB1478_07850 [Nitrospirota bacterium]
MALPDPRCASSYKAIIEALQIDSPEALPKLHSIEVIAGILFGAELAISEKFPFDATMDKINSGILKEMSVHFKELGYNASEVDKLISRVFSRLDEYFQIFTEGKDSNTVFVLGKRLYKNVTGGKERGINLLYIAPSAFLVMVSVPQKSVRKLLDEFKVVNQRPSSMGFA